MIELILVTAEKDSQGPDEKLSIEDNLTIQATLP